MPKTPTEMILQLLERVYKNRTGWTSRCPAHDDRENSLSVNTGKDGRVLIKCFAGCSFDQIVKVLGLKPSHLFPGKYPASKDTSRYHSPIGVEDLARDKALPAEFLRGIGLEDHPHGVLIPYRLADGAPSPRTRVRTSPRAKDGSYWMPKRGPSPIPYGLWKIEEARRLGYLVIVEGESDCWTLWFHRFPVLGIPGATMGKVLQADHLHAISRIFIQQEPDKGGDAFVPGLAKRLRDLGWTGEGSVIHPEGAKDVNDMHKQNPDSFKATFQEMLDNAEPFPGQVESASTENGEVGDLLVAQVLGPLPQHPASNQLDSALREVANRLSGADPLRRGVAREAAIRHLKGLGIGAPAKLVDAAVGVSHSDHSHEADLTPPEPEAWPEPVDGLALLEELVIILKKYLVLPLHSAEMLALWAVHVHALDVWRVSPILVILSPTKRCGKSTLLIILAKLVPRALATSNITPAALYRSVDRDEATLLIDEADSFLSRSDELRGVVNSGHCRDTAYVMRCVGDEHEPRRFRTWGGKAIAAIGRIPSTLEDRGIVLQMRRKAPGEKVTRLRLDRLAHLEIPRRKAMRWVEDHLAELQQADPELPDQLHDRAQDNWRSLVAIADTVGGGWPERARQVAVAFSVGTEEGETTPTILLLSDLRDFFLSCGEQQHSTEAILQDLHDREDRSWREWRKGKPLSAIQLARLLRPFGIRPRTIRVGDSTPKGYLVADFTETFSRYLPPLSDPQHPQHGNACSDLQADSSRNMDGPVAGRKHDLSADEQRDVAGVAAQIGDRADVDSTTAEDWEEFDV